MLHEPLGVCLLPWLLKVAGQPCCWQEVRGRFQPLSCLPVQGDVETPFSKTLATVGSLEGPETPNSVESMVRSPIHNTCMHRTSACTAGKPITLSREPSRHLCVTAKPLSP